MIRVRFVEERPGFVEKIVRLGAGSENFFYLYRTVRPTTTEILTLIFYKMMKKVLLLLTAALLAGAVSAQNYEKNIFSIRGGMNVASMSASYSGLTESSDSRIGYYIGISDEMLLSERLPFYFETGLHFSSRGSKDGGMSYRPMYLQIPVLLNYHFNIKNTVTIQPFAGLYYGLGLGGKIKAGSVKADLFGDSGVLKRSDLGVRLGAGIAYKHFYFGLSYDIGCLNTLTKEAAAQIEQQLGVTDAKIRNNCFTVSVGYNF